MQQTSSLYKELLKANGTVKEVKAVIADEEYLQDRLVSVSISKSMFAEQRFDIGDACSQSCKIMLRDPGDIPKMAEIKLFYRLVNGNSVSEWIAKGTFYIDTRRVDSGSGIVTLNGYDAMLKAEKVYAASTSTTGWPKSDISAVREIASRIGVEVDSRTVALMANNYQIQYPGYGDGAFTMREVLGFIASMYAGNFVISDDGKLYLLSVSELPDETFYLVDDTGDSIVLGGGVKLIVR